jgi:hypothetical protein
MGIEIREHEVTDLKEFIRAGHIVYEGDPAWVPNLHMELRDRFNPKKNPFFRRAEVTLFTAWKNGRLVGRCTAQIDREHLKVWKDDTGFFGFFDTIDDDEVGRALIQRASAWLKERGIKRMRGPLSLYINEEAGVLIEGFDRPPTIMMAHSRTWQGRVCEAAGLIKEKDLLCWYYDDKTGFPPRVIKAWEEIKKLPEVKLRSVDISNMAAETRAFMDIYNDAWAGKWGMVPALPAEVDKVARELKLIIDPELAFMAEVHGKPAGVCIMVPNINEAIQDLHGKLFPTGLFKLLWRMKVKHPLSTRLMMLGIRKEITKNVKRYGGLSAAMYVEVAKRGMAKGYKWGELSWTREDDAPINLGIRSMGAKVYKKYRVYEMNLA